MIQKRTMIVFAVIAVIIVAVPISLLSIFTGEPSLKVVDGNVSSVYSGNFSNISDNGCFLLNASAIAYQNNNSNPSFFNASVCYFGHHVLFPYGNGFYLYTVLFAYSFQGNFAGNVHPKSVKITVSNYYRNGSIDKNTVIGMPLRTQACSGDNVSGLAIVKNNPQMNGNGFAHCIYPLVNYSSFTRNSRYYFWLGSPASGIVTGTSGGVEDELTQIPHTISFTISVLGLSYEMNDTFTYNLINTA